MTLAAVQTAVAAANTAGKQATITTADYTFVGTVRYADSDHRRLVVFVPRPDSLFRDAAGERLVDANGDAFRIGTPPWSPLTAYGSVAYDWVGETPRALTDHPKPWTRHTVDTYTAGVMTAHPEYPILTEAVYVDVKDIVSMTTATASADATLGTVLVSTAAGSHRERDPGWLFGTGLEPATT